ncbi:MAG: hypothetical protein QOE26_2787 [Verrucomicrobiota bacterium]|jgi:hypothetical protein
MKTAIQTQPAVLVTFTGYVQSRGAALRLNPELEGRKVYQIALCLVLDNGFSLEAKQSFPLVRHDFGIRNLTPWARIFAGWLAELPRADRNLFYGLQFTP